jgi:hypothetical protein
VVVIQCIGGPALDVLNDSYKSRAEIVPEDMITFGLSDYRCRIIALLVVIFVAR